MRGDASAVDVTSGVGFRRCLACGSDAGEPCRDARDVVTPRHRGRSRVASRPRSRESAAESAARYFALRAEWVSSLVSKDDGEFSRRVLDAFLAGDSIRKVALGAGCSSLVVEDCLRRAFQRAGWTRTLAVAREAAREAREDREARDAKSGRGRGEGR